VRSVVVLLVLVVALVGTCLIAGAERFRDPLREWILSDPATSRQKLESVVALLAALVSLPLLGFAAYLWSFGGRVLRARQFPPPGRRSIGAPPVCTGDAALRRGRVLRAVALCFGIASAGVSLLLWRFAAQLGGGTA
jgi:hypothetical protein